MLLVCYPLSPSSGSLFKHWNFLNFQSWPLPPTWSELSHLDIHATDEKFNNCFENHKPPPPSCLINQTNPTRSESISSSLNRNYVSIESVHYPTKQSDHFSGVLPGLAQWADRTFSNIWKRKSEDAFNRLDDILLLYMTKQVYRDLFAVLLCHTKQLNSYYDIYV